MGGKIEISMDEYRSLQSDNERLHKTTLEQEKKQKVLNEKIANINDFLEDLKESSLYERVFEWKHLHGIINKFIQTLPKLSTKE